MADKKISELPLLNSLSGSSIIVPIVHDGTTSKLNLAQLGHYTSQWSAKTGSANTFSGNQTINGNLTVSGRLTVNEVVAVYETASVVFSSGSNVFGDALTDVHQFTGSVDINGTLVLNGSAVGLAQINAFSASVNSQLERVYQTTQSLNIATSSIQNHIVGISSFTSSQLEVNTGLASVSASLNNFTASQDGRNFVISQFTSSTNNSIVGVSAFTSSQLAVNTGIASVTASLNQFTSSQDSRNFVISEFTSSTNNHIVGISAFTSSQLAVNLGNAIYTSSVDNHIVGISTYTSSNETWKTGVRGELNGIEAWTASLDNIYATDAQLYQLYQATRSIELHSGSMVGITNGLMAYTASNELWKAGVRGEISAIEAWTASIDNTFATDAQLHQLYQATRSLELLSGSLIGITNGLMAFTAALDNTYATDAQLYQLYQATHSIELHTGSMIGITNGLMAFTAALDNTYATDAQLYQLYQATASLNTVSGSLIGITNGLMAFTAALDNTYATDAQLYQLYAATASLNDYTGSSIGIDGGLMSYTASLKAAAIVSSSTQIVNYNLFAYNTVTSSAATTFYGKVSIATTQSAAPLTIKEQGTPGAPLFRFYGNSSNGDYMRGYWTSQNGETTLGQLTVNGTDNMQIGTMTTAPLQLYTNAASAVEINYLAGANFTGAVTASNFKVPSGGGLDFSATSNGAGSMTSELLDDYETGTWTPVLKGATTAGTYTYDTDRTNGKYVKIGKQVFLQGVFRVDTVSSAGTGNALVSGIPFAPVETDVSWDRTLGTLAVQSGPTLPSASLLCHTQGNTYTDSIGLGYHGMEGWNQLSVTTVDEPNAIWWFSITYMVS